MALVLWKKIRRIRTLLHTKIPLQPPLIAVLMMTPVQIKMMKRIRRMKTLGLQWPQLFGRSVLQSFLYGIVITHEANKLRTIVHAVRSSPQRRQAWYNEVRVTVDNVLINTALMLILDIKTRWSSTLQMCRKLTFDIYSFIYWHNTQFSLNMPKKCR